MDSHNFGPLKDRWPRLYEHASSAEHYVYADPQVAAIKFRCFAEALVGELYRDLQLSRDPLSSFFELLESKELRAVVCVQIISKLHAIRSVGNKAAHAKPVSSENAIALAKDAYLLGQWLFKTHSGETTQTYPAFIIPSNPEDFLGDLRSNNNTLMQHLKKAKQQLAEVQQALREMQSRSTEDDDGPVLIDPKVFQLSASRAAASIDLDMDNTRQLLSLQDAFSEYGLNDGQTRLIGELEAFLATNEESVFLLKGYAGTGKTFITKGLTEYFRCIGRNYILAAPTGKAAKVIAQKTRSSAFTIHKTIYSFKDIAEYRDQDIDGTETFKFYASLAVNLLSVDTVYIVDEASMIADTYQEAEFIRFGSGFLLQDFLKFVNLDHNDHRKKVIFIGDDAQLPPVGMSFSPALNAVYLRREYHVKSREFQLTEVVRQKKGSGILANAAPLRTALERSVFNQIDIDLGYSDVVNVDYGSLMERYLESCGNQINGESIVIAHSNSDVRDFNKRIREHFFPGKSELAAGDKVIALANSDAYPVFISNGDFGLIREVLGDVEWRTVSLKRRNSDSGEVETTRVSLSFRDVVIGFRDLDGTSRFFEAKILEDLLYSAEPSLSSDQSKAIYLDFCIRNNHLPRNGVEFKLALRSDPYFNALRLKFGYAITCHKAQGSEWKNVFVKCNSYMSQLSAEYFRWLYTAITRSTKFLYLLDPPHIKPWTDIQLRTTPGIDIGIETATSENKSPARGPDVSSLEGNATVQHDPQETFGIPASAPFLLSVLRKIRELIVGTGIEIEAIDHNQYQEVYVFCRGNQHSRIGVSYNQKERVTGLHPRLSSDFSTEILRLLSPLKNTVFAPAEGAQSLQYHFQHQFLADFHERLIELTSANGITIQRLVQGQWFQRYTFGRGSDFAVFDVFYNAKHRFGKCAPVANSSSPGTFCGEIGALLTKGMGG
jgi:hypothetical protein